MIKTDIINSVYKRIGFSRNEAEEAVDIVFETIKETLMKGEGIKISRFGTFNVNSKNQRIGRNPKTGEEIMISSRRVLSFKASQILKDKVNRSK
jgi:integration host factor subunit alpha